MTPPITHVRAPLYTPQDRVALTAALRPGHGGVHGTEIAALVADITAYTGARYALCVNSGTAALVCGLVAAGVQPGDEVVTAAYGFVAAPMAAALLGATPVFADVRPDTGTIDPEQIAALITERTRAIVPVSVHGIFCDSQVIERIAATTGIAVVWDHCQAIGSEDSDGRPAGTTGTCSAFSLNESKIWQALEGGVLLTPSDEVHRAAALYACFGEERPQLSEGETRAYWSRSLGTNARLPAISAALARSQLQGLDALLRRGRDNWNRLMSRIREIPGVSFLRAPRGCLVSPWQPCVVLDPEAYDWKGSDAEFRDRIVSALRARGLPVDAWQRHALPDQPVFRQDRPRTWYPGAPARPLADLSDAYPVASRLVNRAFSVGVHPYPLHVQPDAVIDQYAEGFREVFNDLDRVLQGPYEPRRPVPSILPEEVRRSGE
ncbi:MAG: aminotransferase class V-fold PLP-dependent enzyme [Actinobacteria bacterium]|nr:aminotransferase class V-fold PLP-dependent enzyme [Actinomycetota bacterium]